MTEVETLLRSRIALDGPLSIAEYMALALTHPDFGYYTTRQPIGGAKAGDFITAPEVSQMFGELIGVWCLEVWQALGRPSPFALVECGPGRGTLMKDLLRAARAMPEFLNAAQVHLVEVSPTLAEQQSLTLQHSGQRIIWQPSLEALPDMPTIVIGNEFLDALPFRQWVRTGDGWLERGVGLREGKLGFVAMPHPVDASLLPPAHEEQPLGAIVETAPARSALVAHIGDHFKIHTGAALFIDYGDETSGFGDTFQAVKKHQKCDVFATPGECDLTSHVDFQSLRDQVKERGCVSPPIATQGNFLMALGLLERAGALGSGRDVKVQSALQAAVERLAGPNEMGDLFKAFAFGAPASLGERWPGFV